MKNIVFIILAFCISGCSTTAIIPAKATYTYPLQDPFQGYESKGGIGAVAYIDNGSMELYLPLFASDLFKPKRFVFNKTEATGIWAERGDADFKIRMIGVKEPLLAEGSTEVIAILNEGMLLVTFTKDASKYGALAGKRIWLTSTAGPDEIFKVRGVYLKTKAPLDGITK